jgi:hypothetical protein
VSELPAQRWPGGVDRDPDHGLVADRPGRGEIALAHAVLEARDAELAARRGSEPVGRVRIRADRELERQRYLLRDVADRELAPGQVAVALLVHDLLAREARARPALDVEERCRAQRGVAVLVAGGDARHLDHDLDPALGERLRIERDLGLEALEGAVDRTALLGRGEADRAAILNGPGLAVRGAAEQRERERGEQQRAGQGRHGRAFGQREDRSRSPAGRQASRQGRRRVAEAPGEAHHHEREDRQAERFVELIKVEL